MPTPCSLDEIGLPAESEVFALLERCPDILPVSFNEGEYLIREGDEAMDMYLILRGAFVVERGRGDPESGGPAILGLSTCDGGEFKFVGEMAYLGGEFRTASVRSSGKTHALSLLPGHLETVIEEFPFFTRLLCRQFTNRLIEANRQLLEFQTSFKMESEKVLLQKGETLCIEGAPVDRLFQLIHGKLDAEAGGVSVSDRLHPTEEGFVLPELYFKDGAWPVTLKAGTPCLLVAVDRNSKSSVVRNYPELILGLLK